MKQFNTEEYCSISGEISATLTPGEAFLLKELRFAAHSMCASGEMTLKQTGMSGENSKYTIFTQQMGGLSSIGYIWGLSDAHSFKPGHSIEITVPNANNNTYSLDIVWAPLNKS